MKEERTIACPEFGREGFEELLDIVAEFEGYYRNHLHFFPAAEEIRKACEHLEEAYSRLQ